MKHSMAIIVLLASGLIVVCATDSVSGFYLGSLLMLIACLALMRRLERIW
ncbi:MAG TPA: hypothetical protein VET88_13800 [Gammaproteobacteria bacterium]|nr:hypothetical protein [Gammaproteobacteria bacterium]